MAAGEKVQKDGEVEEAEPERPLEEDDQTMPLVDLLNLNRDLGVHDPEGQRILQVSLPSWPSPTPAPQLCTLMGRHPSGGLSLCETFPDWLSQVRTSQLEANRTD